MVATKKKESLTDNPKIQAPDGVKGWNGYYHYMDNTLLPFNTLTYPSANCSIPNYDKVVPDLGKTLLGQEFTVNNGIIGHLKRFTNAGGIEMEMRVWHSGDSNLKDVIEVYFTNNRLVFSVTSGTFVQGETIIGSTSASTGIIKNKLGNTLTIEDATGEFTVGETITGSSSGAIGVVLSAPTSIWRQITQNVNPLPVGAHEYYFDQWFDTKELSTIPNSTASKNIQRAIWVNGYQDPSTKKAKINSWTGGVALITAVTGSTVSIDSSTTWVSLGFTVDNPYIIVNGVSYTVATPADLNTSTINVTSTTGINVGDFAFSKIEEDTVNDVLLPLDMCRQYHGYMYYGNWNQKFLFQSNQFNRDYDYRIVNYQAVDNDLILNLASPYTGTTQSTYHITVDSVNPDVEIQTFTGSLSNMNFITDFYTDTGNVKNNYSVNIVSDSVLESFGGITGTFKLGETIVGYEAPGGTVPTGALASIVHMDTGGGFTTFYVKMLSNIGFANGDVIKGSNSGAVTTAADPLALNGFTATKNGDQILGFTPLEIPPSSPVPILIGDGIYLHYTNSFGYTPGDSLNLTIAKGGADTFKWQKDGGSLSGSIAMTGANQTLSDGISIKFQGVTGHAVGDFWDITAYPAVTRAFTNFYYDKNRQVGEGYKYTLPANFWTMDTQEEDLYVNDTYGKWTRINTTTTVDNAAQIGSETLSATPLKQSSQNKVLYPYLTGHMNNELVYITTNKTLDMISRLIAVDKPQVSYLSDPVKIDFDSSSFIGGSIEYHNKRLYISSPKESVTHCYDFFRSYWQPVKLFPEVGILSIIGNNLVAHSNLRNQSFTMFTNKNGDNGASYTVEIRTPYTSKGMRWKSKYSNNSFIEGYITGNPQLIHTVYVEPNGCGGKFEHNVEPIVCLSQDNAPFGEAPFGSHPFGSSIPREGDYFKELYKRYSPVIEWYFLALGITCSAKVHSYSILTLGMNEIMSPSGNSKFINKTNLPI